MRLLLVLITLMSTPGLASPGQDTTIQILETEGDGVFGTAAERSDVWWDAYQDEDLSRILNTAFTSSPELGAAWARVDLARAANMQMGAALQPVAQFQANATLSPTNTMGFGVFSSIIPDMGSYFEALEAALQAMSAGSGAPPIEFPDMSNDTSDDPNSFMQGSAVLAVSLPLDILGQNTLNWQASKHEVEAAKGSQQARPSGWRRPSPKPLTPLPTQT